jgi:hypothetical protein
MNQGVEIILSRMDSHPHEFEESDPYERTPNKWLHILHEVKQRVEMIDRANGHKVDSNPLSARNTKPLPYLSDEEVLAIHNKLIETQKGLFVKRVMSALLEDGETAETEEEWHPGKMTRDPNGVPLVARRHP